MKRVNLFMLVTALLVSGHWSFVNAQVSIGGIAAPTSGSGINLLLDGSKGGILLPQVEITSFTALPESITTPDPVPDPPVNPTLLGGLLVYNKTAAVDSGTATAIPTGVYYWDSTALSWKLLIEV
ncbi:MAG: hypothetical protein LBN93_05375 [Candidatus Symbiothrix sp.]|jgi:hypothetical protein|nr:hypothetical protein [Candidatus Symbiothrix sp.]